jgi:hypothetical protein
VFVFLIVSLIASSIQELLAGLFALRAATLRKGIGSLLQDPKIEGLAKAVLAHPMIRGTSRAEAPSYVDSQQFALVLCDILERQGAFAGGAVAPALAPLVKASGMDPKAFAQNAAEWFDKGMDRVSGWYKRQTQAMLFIVGIVLAIALNVDAVRVARVLWTQPVVQGLAMKAAEQASSHASESPSTPPIAGESVDNLKNLSVETLAAELSGAGLPVGWTCRPAATAKASEAQAADWKKCAKESLSASCVFGWALTALATSLGAPFWFGLLNSLVNVRAAGPKPQRSDDG